MYRRILVAVDGSDTAEQGVAHAIRLAADQHAQLRVFNAVDDSLLVPAVYAYPVGEMADVIDSLRKSGRKAADIAVQRAAERGVDADCVQVETGMHRVADAIVEHARKWRADLIVMGTHGRRGVDRLVLGSDAERVLRQAPVPVLLVRGGERQPKGRSKAARSRRGQRGRKTKAA